MVAFLYILQSETSGKFYVGSRTILTAGFPNTPGPHTLDSRSWPVEACSQRGVATLLEARRRELQIKRWKSSRMIRASFLHQLVRAGRPGRPGLGSSPTAYHSVMVAFLYILQSETSGKFYVGFHGRS